MQQLSQTEVEQVHDSRLQCKAGSLPVSVVVATRNESRNLPRCLQSLSNFGEVFVIDSQSTDGTPQIAREHGATLVDFHYGGGWPKKRQWALNTLSFANDWILLLDADESVPPDLEHEIERAIGNPAIAGYYVSLRMVFLGKALHHCGASLQKLCLFRRGIGRFECRLKDQDISMCDMEVHEHVVVEGRTAKLKGKIEHHNIESLSRYIQKHNEYSNWEAHVLADQTRSDQELKPSPFGSQAQRRRWLKRKLFRLPGSPVLLFLYRYLLRLGFLDGVPGLIYCSFQAVQMFHTKAKMYELHTGFHKKKG
jgi:glycosyltransferase involved in cell wall biosynthesis